MQKHFSKHHWPKLGVGVVLFKQQQILLGKRINAHGGNTWSLPGGHVDAFESPHESAKRELKEETGLDVQDVTAGPWVNVIFAKEQKHYVTFFMCAKISGNLEPKVLEPDKCKEWCWFDISALPSPLFLPIEQLLQEDKNAFYHMLETMD